MLILRTSGKKARLSLESTTRLRHTKFRWARRCNLTVLQGVERRSRLAIVAACQSVIDRVGAFSGADYTHCDGTRVTNAKLIWIDKERRERKCVLEREKRERRRNEDRKLPLNDPNRHFRNDTFGQPRGAPSESHRAHTPIPRPLTQLQHVVIVQVLPNVQLKSDHKGLLRGR